MFRNMVTSFLSHERITTTDAKAKELRSLAEKMITLGKRGDLHAMRQAAAVIRDKKVVTKLFTTIAPRYKERPGGYTRIVKLGIRPGDNAPVSILELVEEQVEKKSVKKPTAKKAAPKATAPAKAAKAAAVAVEEPRGDAAETAQESKVEAAVAEEITEAPKSAVKEGDDECDAKAD
jgi:large subunit ribosomal protein L17